MEKNVDDLILSATEEADVRAFRQEHPGLTLATSGWDGYRVTFRNAENNSFARVYMSLLPRNYRGEQDGFSLTVPERQRAYEELRMYGVNTENFVIYTAEMFRWDLGIDKAQVSIAPGVSVVPNKEEKQALRVYERSATSQVQEQAEVDDADKMSRWLNSHSLKGSDDVFAWSSKKDDKGLEM